MPDSGNFTVRLVRPSGEHLASYVDALERGWSADNVRGAIAARDELEQIHSDSQAFLASMEDIEAKGPPVQLPDGSFVTRLPGFRRWLWDGEFGGSIGFRWQPGTTALPPHCLGHIGYAVVPWKQGRGYATAALRLLLVEARFSGLPYVEITTDPENIASQRVIETNGGKLIERFTKPPQFGSAPGLRYRIALAVTTPNLAGTRFYHGTRKELKPGDLIEPGKAAFVGTAAHVYLTPNLDEAIWDAELAAGESPGRVYIVEPIGQIENVVDQKSRGHLSMSCRSNEALRVMGEVTEWPLYHGTRADLKPGDLIKPGHTPNFGDRARTTTYVYLTRTLNAAAWGAELAEGDGPGRIYIVEPTDRIVDDPNLTDRKFRGNPTKSFRSREPLRVVGEVKDWRGHSAEALKAMQDGLERLKRLGIAAIDD